MGAPEVLVDTGEASDAWSHGGWNLQHTVENATESKQTDRVTWVTPGRLKQLLGDEDFERAVAEKWYSTAGPSWCSLEYCTCIHIPYMT